MACVSAEEYGIIPTTGIYLDRTLRSQIENNITVITINVMSSLGIWLIVWYLASHLSKMVREREYELAETNNRLIQVQREKKRHLLRITHELKSPFAAIDANIQLLLKGHCGVFSEKALEVLERISIRSKKLGREIQEMLQLGNLRSVKKEALCWQEIDLAVIIRWCIVQVLPIADKRKVIIDEDLVKPGTTEAKRLLAIPARRIAEELGRVAVANTVMLGFLTAVTDIVSVKAMKDSILTSVPKGTEELNTKAFEQGYAYGREKFGSIHPKEKSV